MKGLIAIGLSLMMLVGCGGDDYDEDDAYEDGYEGVQPESESNYDVWCEGLRDAIRSGDQSKSKWNGSGCGTWRD